MNVFSGTKSDDLRANLRASDLLERICQYPLPHNLIHEKITAIFLEHKFMTRRCVVIKIALSLTFDPKKGFVRYRFELIVSL